MNIPKILFYRYGHNRLIKYGSKLYSKLYLKKLLKNSEWDALQFKNGCYIQQTTHPDIIFNELTGRYILTVSYYPFGIERYENSYVFISKDGVHFDNLSGDAIEEFKGDGDSHFSDGELLYDGEYHIYYRYCERDIKGQDIIIKCKSTDLKKWEDRRVIIEEQKDGILSPAIIKCNESIYLYYVRIEQDGSSFFRSVCKESTFNTFDTNKEELSIINMPTGFILWHVNISIINDKYMGLFTLSKGPGGKDAELFSAHSDDEGKTWVIDEKVELGIKNVKKVYRSAFVNVDGKIYIYVSFCTINDCWYTIRKEFVMNTK